MTAASRPIDVYLLGSVARGTLTLSLDNGDALGAYGPAAAVQKFLVNFLTRRGSNIAAPTRGTGFMQQMTSGRFRNEAEVTMGFSAAVSDVLSYLQGIREDSDPDDEQPAAVTLTSVTLLADSVTIAATLITAAGTSVPFTVPFKSLQG